MADRQATKKTPSTQKYLNIAEIRDDCVVMKDGTLRAVIIVSSINFALKSEDEQNAIFAAYISFLNSLEAPLQIVIQSRQLDLDDYLEKIKASERTQTNELLRLQTAEYLQYVSELVELGDIMAKRFYVVVSFDPVSNKKRSFWRRTGDALSPTKIINLKQKEFAKRHKDLFIRIDRVLSGLASMGLRASVLDTQSLIELYYNTYNPEVSKNEKMVDINKLNLEE
ncbi:MAG TPA: TraC family protein [bacterium]|nr:TraC family protein [bacterium]HNS34166.1 TraC family protein [bacterium]HNZ73148.1 TraC family protein [bacterium]HOH67619.1 TraC family protein [bacterium]HQA63820.1 TraC family protein [bacterium]